jgi:uncharacterized protein (TIGR03086 family)
VAGKLRTWGRRIIDREDLARACQAVGDLVTMIEPVQWTAPTPCSEWNVRDVVNHLVAVNLAFAAWVSHGPKPAEDVDLLGGDPVGAYQSSIASLLTTLPPAEVPLNGAARTGISRGSTGAQRLQLRVVDLLTHGWDLSQATGADVQIPDELAERALAFVQSQLTPRFRSLAGFAEPQPVVANAPAIDRLAAFSGRSVFRR